LSQAAQAGEVFGVAFELSIPQAMIPFVLDDDGRWARWTTIRQEDVESALLRREFRRRNPPAVRRRPRHPGTVRRKMGVDNVEKRLQKRTSLAMRTSGIEEVAK
jgi:hypothetical protein